MELMNSRERKRYKVVKRLTFLRFPDYKDKAVTLSYDDGVVYDKKLIEIMNANGLRGTFNLNSGLFAE